ncbi:hypothetical protein HAX54_024379, partial [Datura stramonium]|nr:hypothetical protein [Datura stramonium]
RHDEEVGPYIQQLIKAHSCSQAQIYDDNSSVGTVGLNNEPGHGGSCGMSINRNKAIGKEGRKLASFVGIIARTPDLTPLNVNDWRVFDKEEKIKLVEFLKKKFSIPIRGEEFVKKSIEKKWKDYKCDLKTMCMMKYKTKHALMKNRPSHIPRDQWIGLVLYWLSDKAK